VQYPLPPPHPVPWEQLTTLTVNGSNLQSGFTASVSVGGTNFPLSAASLTFVSSTEVQAPVYMGGATSYTATLNITNPGGLTTSQSFQVSSTGAEASSLPSARLRRRGATGPIDAGVRAAMTVSLSDGPTLFFLDKLN
jgi:hypothetical protein